jgi:hypothetical protein
MGSGIDVWRRFAVPLRRAPEAIAMEAAALLPRETAAGVVIPRLRYRQRPAGRSLEQGRAIVDRRSRLHDRRTLPVPRRGFAGPESLMHMRAFRASGGDSIGLVASPVGSQAGGGDSIEDAESPDSLPPAGQGLVWSRTQSADDLQPTFDRRSCASSCPTSWIVRNGDSRRSSILAMR